MGNAAETVPVYGALPDIFRAAREDNADMLRAALDAGESLRLIDHVHWRTPLHVAALCGSRRFLKEAMGHPTADFWSTDRGGLRPLDLCWHKNDFETHDLLQQATYYPGWFLDLPQERR